MSGSTAKGVDLITIQARRAVKDAIVWRLPIRQQRIRVSGVPIGREEYVKDHLAKKTEEPQVLIDLPLVQDLQSAWLVVVLLRRVQADVLVEVSQASVDR